MRTLNKVRNAGAAVALTLAICGSLLAFSPDATGLAAGGRGRNPSTAAPPRQRDLSRQPTAEEIVAEVRRAVEGIDPKEFDRVRNARLRNAFKRTHARAMKLVATKVDTSSAGKMLEEVNQLLAAHEQEVERAGFTHGDCSSAFSKCQNDCPSAFCGCRLQRLRCHWKASKNYFPRTHP